MRLDLWLFRQACEEIAWKYIDLQREAFKRLGVIGDWDNPYITFLPKFEAKQIEVFGKMASLGCIYKGMRPVYWCPSCETALAEAEIEYMEEHSNSIYVKFPVKDDKGKLKGIVDTLDNLYVVIWTTTTWTLPGNLAISLNPEFVYVVLEPTASAISLLRSWQRIPLRRQASVSTRSWARSWVQSLSMWFAGIRSWIGIPSSS
jgi:isoleucyl-tRNA synthetase